MTEQDKGPDESTAEQDQAKPDAKEIDDADAAREQREHPGTESPARDG